MIDWEISDSHTISARHSHTRRDTRRPGQRVRDAWPVIAGAFTAAVLPWAWAVIR